MLTFRNATIARFSLDGGDILHTSNESTINYIDSRNVILFLALLFSRDRHAIATTNEKSLAILMIVLAVFSNLVAIYSDAHSLFRKNSAPTEK